MANLSNPIVQLSKCFMGQLRAPLLLRTTTEVILFLTGDRERIEQLGNSTPHVRVQNELGIILNYC